MYEFVSSGFSAESADAIPGLSTSHTLHVPSAPPVTTVDPSLPTSSTVTSPQCPPEVLACSFKWLESKPWHLRAPSQ
jgi:hypothetical protein